MAKKNRFRVPDYIKFLFKIYLLGIGFFTFFRLVLLFVERKQLQGIPAWTVIKALFMGFRFDIAVSGYLLMIPFLILFAADVLGRTPAWLKKAAIWFISIVYIISFFLCAADIPFFSYFNSRLTVSLFNWMETPKMALSLVFGNPQYYPYMGMLIVTIFLFLFFSGRIFKTWKKTSDLAYGGTADGVREERGAGERGTGRRGEAEITVDGETGRQGEKGKSTSRWRAIGTGLICFLVLIVGMRGRLSIKSPIRWGTAFFSSYPFVNQLGLNPVFTLARSLLDKNSSQERHYMDDQEAIRLVQQDLQITPDPRFDSPIARLVDPAKMEGPTKAGGPHKLNVVLIVMESMSSALIGHSGIFKPSLTPFLDDLASRSIHFDNFYSTGTHTFNGIWSNLLSMPSFPEEGNMLKEMASMQPFDSLGATLAAVGYNTLFACPHDEQFDNMGGILGQNGFKTIVSQGNIWQKWLDKSWAAPDHLFFESLFPRLDALAGRFKPFLAVLLTVSNHPPYNLPDPLPAGFSPRTNDLIARSVEYADWSLQRFFTWAQSRPWFDNTLFVLVADHGLNIVPRYELNLWSFHTPLLIHGGGGMIKPGLISNIGSQIDLYPTVMGLLNIRYVNNTLGIDLLLRQRPLVFFTADRSLGIVDNRLLQIIRPDGSRSLFDYSTYSLEDLIHQQPQLAEEMKTHVFAQLQTAWWMIKNRQVHPVPLP